MKKHTQPKYITLDFDDFSLENNQIYYLDILKEHYPNLKISMFMIPWDVTYFNRIQDFQRKQVIEMIKQRLDWIELIPHGLAHTPREFEHVKYEALEDIFKGIDEVFKTYGLPYIRGFKAPFWLYNSDLVRFLNEKGWFMAVDRNQPGALRTKKYFEYTDSIDEPFWEQDKQVLKLHGHISEPSSNNLPDCMVNLMKMSHDTEFKFVSECIEESKGPQPTGNQNINTREYWNTIYEDKAKRHEYSLNEKGMSSGDTTNRFLETLKHIKSYDRFIDIGCGIGTMTKMVKKSYPLSEVWGTDISTQAIADNKKEIFDIQYFPGKVGELKGAPSNYFNVVFSGETLEHLDNPNDLFREAALLLKTNGTLIITTPKEDKIRSDEHTFMFTEDDVRTLYLDNQFQDVRFINLPDGEGDVVIYAIGVKSSVNRKDVINMADTAEEKIRQEKQVHDQEKGKPAPKTDVEENQRPDPAWNGTGADNSYVEGKNS